MALWKAKNFYKNFISFWFYDVNSAIRTRHIFCLSYTDYKFICYLFLFVICLFVDVIHLFIRETSTSCENSSNLVKTVLVFLIFFVYLKPVSLRVLVFLIGYECGIQSSRNVLTKSCSENMQHVCSPVNLLHIFRTPFYKNTYRGLLLYCLPYIILTKQPGKCLKKICN